MANDSGPVQTGTTRFAAAELCVNNTVTEWRTVGRFFVNGLVQGWTATSDAVSIFCR